jgi:hypothetical protein
MTGMSTIDRIMNGWPYDISVMKDTGYIIFASLASILFIHNKFKALLFALPFSMLLYLFYCGGDAFELYRIITPYIPVLFFTIAMLSGTMRKYVAIPMFLTFLLFPHIDKTLSKYQRQYDDEANINTAIVLNKVLVSSASVGVFYAGSIPYYTDFYAIDFLGKCEPYIARRLPDITGAVSGNYMNSLPGHNKYDLNYSICRRRPTFIQGCSWGNQNVYDKIKNNYFLYEVPFIPLLMPGEINAILIRK